MKTLQSHHEYGYSMALGAGEVPMLEMAQSYIPLSRIGKTVDINPIIEIRDRNGNLLYEKKSEEKESTIKPGVAYLIWEALSNPSYLPAGWVSSLSVS